MKVGSPLALAVLSLVVGCGSTAEKNGSKADDVLQGDSGTNACGIHSNFKGDDLCIPAPDPADGIQLHVGPSSYDDPDALAPYLLAAGLEDVQCYSVPIPQSDFFYLRQQNRMRPSSHHMLITVSNDKIADGGLSADCDLISGLGSIPGSQTPSSDFPNALGPEDQGLGRYLPQSTTASFQLHYINLTTDTVLREVWVNLYKKDAAQVTQRLQSIFMVGDFAVAVPPHTRQTTTLAFQPPLTSETRVFEANAHMHAHAQSFTLWRGHGGQEDVIYQSFSWEDPLQATFNSVVKNPTANPTANGDGAISGILNLEPGDTLRWACDVNNTLDTTLHFANEALKAEMCMLVGSYISPTPGLIAGACSSTGSPQCASGLF